MAEDRSRLTTIATPEGPAHYPFGSWGRGYILDASTQAAMARYLRWCVWVAMPLWPISSAVGRRVGVDDVVSCFGGWLVFCALHAGAMLFILRNCKTAATRVTPEEFLRRAIEQRGHLGVESAWWCGLIAGACATAGVGLTLDGLERWLFVMAGVAWVGFAGRQLWRIKRLDVPDPHSPASRP